MSKPEYSLNELAAFARRLSSLYLTNEERMLKAIAEELEKRAVAEKPTDGADANRAVSIA